MPVANLSKGPTEWVRSWAKADSVPSMPEFVIVMANMLLSSMLPEPKLPIGIW